MSLMSGDTTLLTQKLSDLGTSAGIVSYQYLIVVIIIFTIRVITVISQSFNPISQKLFTQ